MILNVSLELPDNAMMSDIHIALIAAAGAAAINLLDEGLPKVDETRDLSEKVRDGSYNVQFFRSE